MCQNQNEAQAETSNKAIGEHHRTPTISATIRLRAELDFAQVLQAVIHDGRRATRAGWNATGQHIEAQYPDKGSKMTAPYLVLKNAQNQFVPWVPSQGDLFAHDWAVFPHSVTGD